MGLVKFLGTVSGEGTVAAQEAMLFNKVIGFRGVVEGVGTSTIVQGLANAFSDRTKLRVCVVDTSILYPSQYAFLCNPFSDDVKSVLKDWFSLEVSIPERIIDTKYKHISLLGCYNRRLTDAFSTVDTLRLVEETFDVLKSLFDVIIVDLSHEWSQIAMCSARQCNKIFTVVDPSARSVNNLLQSLNNLAICAVPFHKYCTTIISKYSANGILGLDAVINRAKLIPVAQIPFSQQIFEAGTMSKSIWGLSTQSYEVEQYNRVIDQLLVSIVNESPLDVLDLKAQEEIERAVAESSMRNKRKAREAEMKKREALLSPVSEDVKAKAKTDRHAKNEAFLRGDVVQDDSDDTIVDFEAGMMEDETARVDFGGLEKENGEDGDAQ